MGWQDIYQQKRLTVDEAAGKIRSGQRVVSSTAGSVPATLIDAIGERGKELRDVTLSGALLQFPFEYARGSFLGKVRHHTIFMGAYERSLLEEGNIDVTSYAFSSTDWLVKNRLKPDVYIAEVSPPDENGDMSLGPMGTFYTAPALECAKTVIVQVNRRTPYVYGCKDAFLNVKDVDWICEADHDLASFGQPCPSDIEQKIAGFVLHYFEDGVTFQLGIGGVANAIGFALDAFKDLGVHTEMLTDSMMPLINKGVVTGSRKTLHPGEVTIGFGLGSNELYKFMDHNKALRAYPISYVVNPYVIGQNANFRSINATLMCDLTGQACSESIGFRQFSGTGGQLDFVRGAAISEGGKSFLCFPSTAKGKDGTVTSRINSALPPGAVVTTPRTDVQYFVTEYGVADVRNRCISERVKELIKIAHPQFRDRLVVEAREAGLISKFDRIAAAA